MKTTKFFLPMLLVCGILITFSCNKEETCNGIVNTSYDTHAKSIIDATCATSGCHDGTGVNVLIPAGSADYTTYAGIKASLDDGKFTARALDAKTMPPTGLPQLTEDQLATLNCWKDGGFAEN